MCNRSRRSMVSRARTYIFQSQGLEHVENREPEEIRQRNGRYGERDAASSRRDRAKEEGERERAHIEPKDLYSHPWSRQRGRPQKGNVHADPSKTIWPLIISFLRYDLRFFCIILYNRNLIYF
jgi:hypothetical protein